MGVRPTEGAAPPRATSGIPPGCSRARRRTRFSWRSFCSSSSALRIDAHRFRDVVGALVIAHAFETDRTAAAPLAQLRHVRRLAVGVLAGARRAHFDASRRLGLEAEHIELALAQRGI